MKHKIKKFLRPLKKYKTVNFIYQFILYIFSKNPKIPKEELEIFNLLKDELKVVFDVGSRDDLSFYNLKNNCIYYLFEPNEKFIKSLKNKISLLKDHHIIINEFGLSDENKDNCIYYENSQSFVINPMLKVGFNLGKKYSLRKLDDYVIKNNIMNIDFLKIDAEGLDYKIILGGLDTIKNKVSYIQFENDGAQKYVDILGNNFDLYLMMESCLLKVIIDDIFFTLSEEQKKIDYHKSLIKLDENIIDLIENKLKGTGYGSNILGISKKIKKDINQLIFTL